MFRFFSSKNKKLNIKRISKLALIFLMPIFFVCFSNVSTSNADTKLTIANLSFNGKQLIKFGRLNGQDLIWRWCGFDTDCSSTGTNAFLILENFESLSGYNGMPFDPIHTGEMNDRATWNSYGCNVYRDSTLRYWLNSDKPIGQIVYPDSHADPYNKNGFLYEFYAAEKKALVNVRHKHYTYSKYGYEVGNGQNNWLMSGSVYISSVISNADTACANYTDDTVFCLSHQELKNAYDYAISNSTGFNWNTSANQTWYFIRDMFNYQYAYSVGAQNVGFISNNPCGTNAGMKLRPACIIKSTTQLIDLGSNNYQVVTVSPIIGVTINGVSDKTYTGSAVTQSGYSLTDGDYTLVENTDYTVSYSANVNPGTVTMTFTAMGSNYSGSTTATFKIQRDLSSSISISEIPDEVYTSGQICPTGFTITDSVFGTLTKDTHYSVSYGTNTAIGEGSGSITISGVEANGYIGSKTFTFNIVPIQVDTERISINLDDSNLTYTRSALTPNFTVLIDGVTAVDPSNYTIEEWSNNTNANMGEEDTKASVKIKLSGIYDSGSVTKSFNIHPVSFTGNSSITMENIPDNLVYDGSAKNLTGLVLKWNTSVLSLEDEYELEITNNINAGSNTGAITVKGKGNFTGSKVFNFSIAPKSISSSDIVISNLGNTEWTGSPINPQGFVITDEGIVSAGSSKVLVLNSDYENITYGENINLGSGNGSITVSGKGNYQGSKTFNFDIVGVYVESSKIHITPSDDDIVYDGSAKTFGEDKLTVLVDGKGTLSSSDYEITGWDNNIDANMHQGASKAKVKVKLKGNYGSDEQTVFFDIHPLELQASDFEFAGSKIVKDVTKKSEYTSSVLSNVDVQYINNNEIKLEYTNASYVGVDPSDMNFGDFDIMLSGLSIGSTNYKLSDSFTSFNIGTANGELVDKIRPELLDEFLVIDTSNTYKVGDEMFITLKFDKDLKLESGETPVLWFWSDNTSDGKIGTLTSGSYLASANYESISGKEIKFKYVINDGDLISNGFTFKLKEITNQNLLTDLLGNEINVSQKSKTVAGLKIVTFDAVITDVINSIQGNKTKDEKKQIILNILSDDDMSDTLFSDPDDADLKAKIGSGALDDTLREDVSDYLSNITLTSGDKDDELILEIRSAIGLFETIKEIDDTISDQLVTKEVIDNEMIRFHELSPNQKKNFDAAVRQKLENAYYGMFTDDYKYKDGNVEMYGIVTRTSAGSNPVVISGKLANDLDSINTLQSLIAGKDEKIVAPFELKLRDKDDSDLTVTGPYILVRIELPDSYFGKIKSIYHVDGTTLEELMPGTWRDELSGNKTEVYFKTTKFSPFFLTSEDGTLKQVVTNIDPSSTPGKVVPDGISNLDVGGSETFTFEKSGNTNRVDVIIKKYDESSGTYVLVPDIEPINLYEKTTYKLDNIDSDILIEFKFSHDDNFKAPSGGGGGGGGGGSLPKDPIVTPVVPPVDPIASRTLFKKAYMNGYEDKTFRPSNLVTREEVAVITARLFDSFDEKASYEKYNDFDDSKTRWSSNYIGFIKMNGFIKGYNDGSFKPTNSMTRAELATLVANILEEFVNLDEVTRMSNITFTDIQGMWYEEDVMKLAALEILNGYEDGSFKGNNFVTRIEVAIVMNKLTGRILDEPIEDEYIKKVTDAFSDVAKDRWFFKYVAGATQDIYKEEQQPDTQTDKSNK